MRRPRRTSLQGRGHLEPKTRHSLSGALPSSPQPSCCKPRQHPAAHGRPHDGGHDVDKDCGHQRRSNQCRYPVDERIYTPLPRRADVEGPRGGAEGTNVGHLEKVAGLPPGRWRPDASSLQIARPPTCSCPDSAEKGKRKTKASSALGGFLSSHCERRSAATSVILACCCSGLAIRCVDQFLVGSRLCQFVWHCPHPVVLRPGPGQPPALVRHRESLQNAHSVTVSSVDLPSPLVTTPFSSTPARSKVGSSRRSDHPSTLPTSGRHIGRHPPPKRASMLPRFSAAVAIAMPVTTLLKVAPAG